MKLCDYLKDLSIEERADFAKRCDTSPDYLWQIGDGRRKPKAALCIDIERESDGKVSCEELLPEADWAYIRRRKVVA
jgi:DNA-binding transcriptional regulator YdaS (Cro superfamily)